MFWQTLPSHYLPLALWLEADRMATLRIDDEAFRREREVVKEERRMRVENQPYGRLSEIIFDHAFTTHPYKHPTIGSMVDLEAASIADVREFHETYYVPENATVTIVGDFDAEQTLQMVNQYLARVPKAKRPVPRDLPKEPPQTKERRAVVEETWPLPAVVVAYHITYDGHPDAYPLHIAAKIMSDGQSARIPRELVYNKRIALTAFGSGNIIEDPNLFYAVAIVQPGQTPEAAERALIAEFEKMAQQPVADRRVAARQEPVRARLHRQPRVERGQGAAPLSCGGDSQRHHDGRRRVRHLHERDASRRAARRQDLLHANESCRAAHPPEGRIAMSNSQLPTPNSQRPNSCPVLGIGSWLSAVGSFLSVAPAFAQTAEWPTERAPRPLAAREVKFPPFQVKTLSNGMQVITVAHHEQPAVTMRHARAGRCGAGSGEARADSPSSSRSCSIRGRRREARSRLPIRSIRSVARWAPGRVRI